MERKYVKLFGEAQDTLQRNSGDFSESALAIQQLKVVANHVIEGKNDRLIYEEWRLGTLVKIVNEIKGYLAVLCGNAGDEKLIRDSVADVLHILHIPFKFCQMASEVCSNELPESLESLSALFKLSYQSLKGVMDIVEKFPVGVFSYDLNFLPTVFSELILCSEVLVDIDVMASVAVWKSIKRLFTIYKDVECEFSDFHCLFCICNLTRKTLLQLIDLLEKKEEAAISKYHKVTRFYLGIILQLVKDFKEVMKEGPCHQVYDLIHLIQRLSMREMHEEFKMKGCSVEYEHLSNSLFCVIDPLLKDFINIPFSTQCILRNDLISCGENREQSSIVHLMIVLNVIEHLSTNQELLELWVDSSQMECSSSKADLSIVDVVFLMVETCSSQLFVPRKDFSIIDMSKCLKEVSLYELILGRTCMFVLTLPAHCFPHIESVMLSNVLHKSEYRTLLATDLWCFVSRWGKPELSLNHFIFLGKLLNHLRNINASGQVIYNVSRLMQRLFWFLEEGHHAILEQSFPVSASNIFVWMLIPLSHFRTANKVGICLDLINTVVSLLQLKDKRDNTDQQIVCGIKCLSNMLSDNDLHLEIPENTFQNVAKPVAEFWHCFKDVNNDIEISEQLMVSMLALTSQLMLFFDGKQISVIISVIGKILQSTDSESFQLQCGDFLANLKDIKFPFQVETECLNLVRNMFRFMLSQHRWMIEQVAMEALKKFAEVTAYTTELVKFLPSSRKKDFANYLKKESINTGILEDKLSNAMLTYLSSLKKPNDMDCFEDIIGKIESNVFEWQRLTKDNPPPPKYSVRVKNVITLLESSFSS